MNRKTVISFVWMGFLVPACAAPVARDGQDSVPDVPAPAGDDTATTGDDTGTAPTADDDADGLSNEEEKALGTDPDQPDTDEDGTDDGAEVDAGTNPLYAYSHPYAGGYNVGYCGDGLPDATGPTATSNYSGDTWPVYQPGDVARDFSFVDQHGEAVHLYSFCDRTVMLAFVGSGSEASLDLTSKLQAMQEHYGADRFQVIALLVDQGASESSTPTKDSSLLDETVTDIVADSGLETVPLLRLTMAGQATGGTWNDYERDYALPTTAFVDGTMRVLSVDDYEYDPGSWLQD